MESDIANLRGMKREGLFMKKILLSILVIFLTSFFSAQTLARCGYYVGWGYRCFPDKPGETKAKRGGGTGGKVFKKMEENEKECGYFDPGCQRQKKSAPPAEEEEHEYEETDETE